jgi:excisionase family DNA binding protein
MDDLLTTAEAGAVVGVKDSRIRQYIAAGRLTVARRIGGAILLRREDAERLRDQRRPSGRPPKTGATS